MFRSVSTINADVALKLEGAAGAGIVVAILSSGIDESHPHFASHRNLELPSPLEHKDFTGGPGPLVDANGHGTGVAAIVAGGHTSDAPLLGAAKVSDVQAGSWWQATPLRAIAGMAPAAKLLSLRILDDNGMGNERDALAALDYVGQLNERGSNLRVHVLLAPIGYSYDEGSCTCGKSPICVEVDRLVRSGVLVVSVSGNSGFGFVNTAGGASQAALSSTIMDPGNAELGVTVGSTHRDLPTDYGISYFSSRGPTHDGRPKPDLVGPGERIMTAVPRGWDRFGSGLREDSDVQEALYVEQSGTSFAAAHVAGVAAQVLSVRPALCGRPLELKRLLMESAVDLGRVQTYQGSGLVDALGALAPQSKTEGAETEQRRSRDLTAARVREEASPPLKLMCCYSHKDEVLLEELQAHLKSMEHQRRIDLWWDRRIEPGTKWNDTIADELSSADIIVPLVSADFIKSDYCYGVELLRAIERHNDGDVRVVPVIVRVVDYTGTPLEELQALPKDARAVTSWTNADEAWFDVAHGIRRVVETLDAARGRAPGPTG